MARLTVVQLHRCDFDLINPDPDPPFGFESGLGVVPAYRHPIIVYNVNFEFKADSATGDDFFSGELRYFVCYEVPREHEEFGADEIEAFGDVSAAFAAWPYIREFLHGLTARADVPPLVLDVMRRPIEDAGPRQARASKGAAKSGSAAKKAVVKKATAKKAVVKKAAAKRRS